MLALYTARVWPAINRKAVLDAFDHPPAERHALLAGRAKNGQGDDGRTICSCNCVGEKAIQAAIAAGCHSVAMLGEKLKCGTNCGSCLPEISALLPKTTN